MTMKDVDHTHPHTNEPFGELHNRGAVVAADGGRDEQSRSRQAKPDGGHPGDDETETERMEDVSHEPPSEGANRAFERGTEGRDETV
ncbi:MAG: hypothetical protein V5A45_11715 [Haloarculaceae archaeon]